MFIIYTFAAADVERAKFENPQHGLPENGEIKAAITFNRQTRRRDIYLNVRNVPAETAEALVTAYQKRNAKDGKPIDYQKRPSWARKVKPSKKP
jgi:hypothetical protein